MALFQWCYKWTRACSAVMAVVLLCGGTWGCHPSSRELHICLNIYLERDFSLIETFVEGQAGRRRVILEGKEQQSICRHISSLVDCYAPLVMECDTLWQLDRFERVQHVLRATHSYLCEKGANNVRDLLLHSGCMALAKPNIADCTGFNWWLSWREVLRMQVSPSDRCVALETYRNCLQRRLPEVVCGTQASKVYVGLIDVWLNSWCGLHSTPEEERKYLYYALNAGVNSVLNQSSSSTSGQQTVT